MIGSASRHFPLTSILSPKGRGGNSEGWGEGETLDVMTISASRHFPLTSILSPEGEEEIPRRRPRFLVPVQNEGMSFPRFCIYSIEGVSPPVSQVDEIKSALDIVQVVSETVDLDTRSRTPKANCPFHAERTPSFVVFPESGTWRCFGACAVGGDVISFIQKRDDLDFRGALKAAASRAGIELDDRAREKQETLSPLISANDVALGYFWTNPFAASSRASAMNFQSASVGFDIFDCSFTWRLKYGH